MTKTTKGTVIPAGKTPDSKLRGVFIDDSSTAEEIKGGGHRGHAGPGGTASQG